MKGELNLAKQSQGIPPRLPEVTTYYAGQALAGLAAIPNSPQLLSYEWPFSYTAHSHERAT